RRSLQSTHCRAKARRICFTCSRMAALHASPPAPELQHAQQPPLHLPGPPDATLCVVKDTSVAQEGASLRGGDDLPERRDAVLPRHGQPSCKDEGEDGLPTTPTLPGGWRPASGPR